MKTKTCLSLVAAFAASALVAATPVIKADSVTFSQNTSTRLVTIGYTLEETDAVVTVDVLTNGVSIGEENFTNIDGDVNRRVAPGDHLVVWHPRASWPDHVFTNNEVSVEVRAWDVTIPPDYMVVDLTATNALVRYYVSTNALPAGGLTNDIYRSTKLVMRRIPASGNMWTMGSPESEPGRVDYRETQRLVTMTNDFYLGIYPVTRLQQQAAIGVSWTGTGMFPAQVAYTAIRDAGWPENDHVVASGYLKQWRAKTGIDLDLPTSAQWEFACRAGTSSAFYFDTDGTYNSSVKSTFPALKEYGWFDANSSNVYHVPGGKKPNPFGLYDMHGNIHEWCLDWVDQPSSDSVVEPKGPATANVNSSDAGKRVARGGTYASNAEVCRSAKINPYDATKSTGIGYRLLCPPQLKW